MQEPTVGDMSITDQHAMVGIKATFQEISGIFLNSVDSAILVQDAKSGDIAGVVTIKDMLASIGDGAHPKKERVSKRMRTNIIQLPSNTPLSQALPVMAEQRPDAVVVRGADGSFVGYFSPEDYRDASRKLESHQTMAMRMQKTRSALKGKQDEAHDAEPDDPLSMATSLLDIMLGDNEDDGEEEESAFSLGGGDSSGDDEPKETE